MKSFVLDHLNNLQILKPHHPFECSLPVWNSPLKERRTLQYSFGLKSWSFWFTSQEHPIVPLKSKSFDDARQMSLPLLLQP